MQPTSLLIIASLNFGGLLLGNTFYTDFSTSPSNVSYRNAAIADGKAILPASTTQGYVDIQFPGFNLAQPFTLTADLRLNRGANPSNDGIEWVTADFGQIEIGYGGADNIFFPPPPMLVVLSSTGLDPWTPTPFHFADGEFHRLSLSYDGTSHIDVTIDGTAGIIKKTVNFTFAPTSDLTLTMHGVNGIGGMNEIDALSFSSPGLEVVPEPSVFALALIGAVSLAVPILRRRR